MDVFINDISVFLPNEPIDNDAMENVLGKVNEIASRTKKIILRNNKINTRYYAIDPISGDLTHTNVEITAKAIRGLSPSTDFNINDIQLLCSGSSSPDSVLPGLGVMVHGELGISECEVISTAGICLSGICALKYAQMSIISGNTTNAVATGSELASSFLRSKFFDHSVNGNIDLESNPELAFSSDFLRWMLSDGAGAMYLSNKKNESGISLKIDWIEIISYAGEFDTCMYQGAIKQEDGTLKGYREFNTFGDATRENCLAVQQDVKLLNDHIVNVAVDRALVNVAKKRNLNPEDIDWYLPHFSSGHFQDKLFDRMKEIGFYIPIEKWFTNLFTKGNVGSAAIYVILEEIYKSDKLKIGDKILMMIPESGRFSVSYVLLTVV
ncbi:MAG: beta-ketoacyl-ACP synthase III [Flavobacteriales bacterium]|nr:beta-ketoacyl-ACP synthase III [Flavobacteriales bacterium]